MRHLAVRWHLTNWIYFGSMEGDYRVMTRLPYASNSREKSKPRKASASSANKLLMLLWRFDKPSRRWKKSPKVPGALKTVARILMSISDIPPDMYNCSRYHRHLTPDMACVRMCRLYIGIFQRGSSVYTLGSTIWWKRKFTLTSTLETRESLWDVLTFVNYCEIFAVKATVFQGCRNARSSNCFFFKYIYNKDCHCQHIILFHIFLLL